MERVVGGEGVVLHAYRAANAPRGQQHRIERHWHVTAGRKRHIARTARASIERERHLGHTRRQQIARHDARLHGEHRPLGVGDAPYFHRRHRGVCAALRSHGNGTDAQSLGQVQSGDSSHTTALEIRDDDDVRLRIARTDDDLARSPQGGRVASAGGTGTRLLQRSERDAMIEGQWLHHLGLVVEQHDGNAIRRTERRDYALS